MPVFVKRISEIPQEFVCKLCTSPWDPASAVTCPQCNDIYCHGCVEDNALKQRQCNCGQVFSTETYKLAHRSIRDLADAQVLVKCKNFLRGCNWEGTRTGLTGHHDTCAAAVKPKCIPVGPVPDVLLCAVCHELISDAVSLPCCEKLLCNTCAIAALAMRPQCPMCNAALTTDGLQKAPKQIDSQLDSFLVRCVHHDIGCRFEGHRRNFAGHIAQYGFEQGLRGATATALVTVLTDVPHLAVKVPAPQQITTLLHIQAPVLESLNDRKMPLRMIAVIDVSGSMKGAKLNLTIESLLFMVNELTDKDSFGLVAFDSTIDRVMPLTRMGAEEKATASRLISALREKDCTNLCGGLLEGLLVVKEAQATCVDTADAVLLFTDGQANEGTTDPSSIVAACKSASSSMAKPPAVYTFGFGSDHNATLLQRIAEVTQGSYYYIKDSSVLKDSFADCLGGLISIVLSDIKVKFTLTTPSEGQLHQLALHTIMTRFPAVTNSDGSVTIHIKDMYSAEVRDIPLVVNVTTANANVEESVPLVSWQLSYTSAIDQMRHDFVYTSKIDFAAEPFSGSPDMYVDEQRNRFTIAVALEEAKKAAEERRFADAQKAIAQVVSTTTKTHSACQPQVAQMMSECQQMQAVMTESAYSRGGSQAVSACVGRHMNQRANDVSEEGMYQTEWKKAMKKK